MVFQFLSFVRNNRAGAFLSGAAALFTYGPWLIHEDITVDSEIMIADPEAMLESWLGINRFGLVFTKKLFGMTSFVPFFSKLLTVVLLWLTAMFLAFCVYEWSGRQRRFGLFTAVFPVLYLTGPCFAEQFYFVLQSAEVAFALLLCGLSVYGAGQYAVFRKSPLWAVGSAVLMIWAFGTYQAMAAVVIALSVVLFMTAYLRKDTLKADESSFGWLFCSVRLAAVFLAGFMMYLAIASWVRFVFQGNAAYVDQMIHWRTEGFYQCLWYIIGELKRVFYCYYPVFRQEFFWILLLFSLSSLVWAAGRRKKGILFYLAALGVFLISPFFMTIVTGFYQPVRAHLVYPFVYAFAAAFLTAAFYPEEEEAGEKRKKVDGWRMWAARGVAVLCLIFSWRQGYDMARLFQTIHRVSEEDIALTRDIYSKSQRLAAKEGISIEDCTFIFLGKRGARLSEEDLRGDVIGCSFYQWDADSSIGSSRRIYDLMQALGLPAQEPVLSRYLDSLPFAKTMECYPGENSILLDEDTVIVKLSEPMLN